MDMRGFKIYVLFVCFALTALFAACERVEVPALEDSADVKLFARMGVHLSVEQQTKGDGAISSTTNKPFPIGVVRLDEKTGDAKTENYPYFTNCQETPLTATVGEPDASEGNLRQVSRFSTPQFFKNSQDEVTYAAWYPWRAGESGYNYSTGAEGTVITFPIEGDSDIMYSDVVSGTMQTGFEVMKFNHALSLFRIHVYKSTDFAWGSLKSVAITGLPDICKVTLPASENKGHKIEYSNSAENSSGINMSYTPSGGVEIPKGFENKAFVKEWIAAPSEPTSGGEDGIKVLDFSVNTEYESTVYKDTVSIARNFEPGYVYDIVLRFSDNGVIDAQVQIAEWEDGGKVPSDVIDSKMFFNLSAYGTANCYIVSSANFGYSFNARVKGNGNSDAMGGIIDPVLDPKFVDVVWADRVTAGVAGTEDEKNGGNKWDFELETNKIVEGKVLFRVNGDENNNKKELTKEGNVLLGVYDKEGKGRKCLWTWHIWITDKPQIQDYENGYMALDRNLGATAPAPEGGSSYGMYGLFYQWGRPTPFHIDWSAEENKYVIHGENSYTRVTPDVAVQNPEMFYGRFAGNADGTEKPGYDGTKPLNTHDWVDRDKFQKVDNLWGYRETEHLRPIKTLYDPCPHGYHVPYSRTWEKLDSKWENKPNPVGSPLPSKGVQLNIHGVDIWYPLQGYIDKDGVYQVGHIHIIKDDDGSYAGYKKDSVRIVEVWSSLVNRHVLGDLEDDSPYRFLVTKDYGMMLSDQYSNRTRGLAVRCVSDNTADVVKDLSASQTANCYMIHEDGYYKFKTTVRGNGVGSLLPLGGTTSAEINGGLSVTMKPAKVDILWWQGDFTKTDADFKEGEIKDFPSEAIDSTTQPKNICINILDNGVIGDDGYVAFQVSNFQKGNYVLAAYDQADNILWTWHLWFTDKPKDILSGNYTKMDRFLGATYAPVMPADGNKISWTNQNDRMATLGFYYQWGRKDPIIGPPGYDSRDDNTSSGGKASSSGWWMKMKDKKTRKWSYRMDIDVKDAAFIPDVTKEPTAFYKSKTTGRAKDSQWFPEDFADAYTNVALWGYAVKDYSIQGQTFSKTMHDPCPPGYRTPFHFSWRYDDTYKYAEGDNGDAVTTFANYEGSFDDYGIVTNMPHFHKMWFPLCGYRNPTTGNYTDVGEMGYMNTGMPMGDYNTRSFWFSLTQSGQYANNTKHGSAYGKMVRCMKE